ncbi:MAG: gliding motility-associated protein GldE [Bacteroidales bacterium]|nr:gliding motility-associated protein GldE [Bacteroidales bacterium]MBD5190743.1 gliding motility-associated protein GldE [Bacteroidales bacterium]MBD5208733.1 gliding motility-associated protein GldE [Bacteroidales bacterium]
MIILAACLCLAISAFVSGSEIAYFGLTRSEIEKLDEEKEDDPQINTAVTLIKNSERLLATILICNNLVNIMTVVLLTFAINHTVEFNNPVVSFLLQTVLLTFLLLLCGEIIPKLIARTYTVRWVVKAAPFVMFFYRLTGPLAMIMVRSSSIINRIIAKKQETVTTDVLEKALEISDIQEGQEKEMLEGILSFGETKTSEIMISRVDVTDIEYHATWSEVMQVILNSGFSRIPVYDRSQDTIRGILYSKDLLPYIGKRDDSFRWQTLLREAYFVPESRMIDDLLEDFRKKKIHIAIVIDEYGGTQGIVTLEDIIEEIVGEIDDEYDEQSSLYRKIGDDTYIFDAKVPLGEFCRDVDIDEEELGDIGDAETLAGLLLEIKGDFPERKESLQRGPCRFLVVNIDKHRITKVRVNIDRKSQESEKDNDSK